MNKPSVFIGSSSEGLEFARAVRSLLTQDAEITLWNEGLFGLGSTFIETLITSLSRFDFAILIFTPDDIIQSRDVETFSPRDNVIFELGLFMGFLGRSRTFVLHQSNAKVKIPSDLAGMVTATYEWPREDKSYKSAVGAACDSIRDVIRDLGIAESKVSKVVNNIQQRQERQEAEIRSLQITLQGIVTQYELEKLVGLSKQSPFLCYYSDDLIDEIKRLRAMNLVKNHEGVGLRVIMQDYKDKKLQFDLRQFFYLTEQGRDYLRVRRELLQDEL